MRLTSRNILAALRQLGGPATPPANPGPDLVLARPDMLLVSDESKVLRGVLAAGSISGSTVAFTGTSVAAPQLAAWAAEQLAKGGDADRPGLLNPVVGSSPNASTPPILPDERRGVGRLERPPLTRVKR